MRLVVVAGPTASGKTALAIALARRLGGEIVNADSQQVYRGLDVGTAKPTAEERAAAPHHLLDLVEPGEGMDAARFAALADAAIAGIAARGRVPIVAGGTGLYVRALLHGVVEAPGRDPALRAALEEEAARLGRPAVHARLAAVDPAAAALIRPNDLVRVVRALEIAAGGRTPSELYRAHAFREDRYDAALLALDPPRAELHARIDARVRAMFAGGLLDEARALEARFDGALPARLPIGYAEAAAHLRGELDLEEAIRRVQVAHRRYARRQVIWLRKERGVAWIAPPHDVEALARRVLEPRPPAIR
ncbi:tRNA delta(2)-isopentenylpyrophosphate transferase [Anaeromyxobacter sp. K]|uniref:tRNA dimethylallyltransferase n=1 Tax=Anaeromyxobacter sp. (strain K) TaxID=447217 RepID=MIAA_ANASK|nr:tRNA (adenosine(37)-N6)-dimethylallyltransferase MiaA [Anaeromyxobacter sp. K]B4UEL1.1 RecName: Full=tRNA dimethylallyltransferase; AltName: Full=Dimethylallyl diphosphate:tRNA dimethylallyltransferase; Short=DMAPP:tRNA dimethylallyltransferase; Short=DMATase; AltName: Full=Isopentenyl-diphosphate:tRNA isopentenyltransferase; Short=IPP transferase; Short=IPPT; Short=IPTase [Anaeromyxobacter sp. K]ACG73582.1 tRNA delta(2)-isopentenylpyrophosphate transferase [Anaeromyxobacter sp. K]